MLQSKECFHQPLLLAVLLELNLGIWLNFNDKYYCNQWPTINREIVFNKL